MIGVEGGEENRKSGWKGRSISGTIWISRGISCGIDPIYVMSNVHGYCTSTALAHVRRSVDRNCIDVLREGTPSIILCCLILPTSC